MFDWEKKLKVINQDDSILCSFLLATTKMMSTTKPRVTASSKWFLWSSISIREWFTTQI